MEKLNGKILMKSFDSWAKASKEYSVLYKTLPREVLKIPFAYFHEEKNINHMTQQLWWAREHNRFIRNKDIKQRELELLNEITVKFITAYLTGKLEKQNDKA